MSLNTNKQPLVVVVGPTASGKSDLSIKIAKKFNGEIISADSRQVYRGMDIGTGKVTKKEQRIVKHYLIDVVSPKKQFSASDFKRLGEGAIKEIETKGKIPIIVGGTGFYIDILLGRMQTAEVKPNKRLRAKLEKQSAEQLFKRLQKLDPDFSKKIDRHNKRRLIRALEIAILTGKPVPPFRSKASGTFDILWVGLKPKNLQRMVKKRLEQRLKHGMIKEVKRLLNKGIGHKRLQRFGLEYKWLSLYLQNKTPYAEMKEELLRDIIRYSKRQMTWFKRNKEIYWLTPSKAERIVSIFLQKMTH